MLLTCGIPFLTVGIAQGGSTFAILGGIFAASGGSMLVLGMTTWRRGNKD